LERDINTIYTVKCLSRDFSIDQKLKYIKDELEEKEKYEEDVIKNYTKVLITDSKDSESDVERIVPVNVMLSKNEYSIPKAFKYKMAFR